MTTKPYVKIASSLLTVGIILCSAPAVLPSDNGHSALSLHINKNDISPGEPLMLSFDISAVPLRVSGYIVFVTPGGETYSLRGDGSFAQGIHPIITGAGPIDRPITIDILALPPCTISAGSYKVYAALVAYPSELSRSGYRGFDSAEFNVTEKSTAAEAALGSSNILTILTYSQGYYEGHLITFPDSTTMSIDCASGSVTTKSHFHQDHCAACGSGDYNRNNVYPGQVIYNKDGVTVTVVAANGRVIGQGSVNVACPASDENPMSMALLVKYGGFDYLSGGDLYGSVEGPLGSALAALHVNVDVLKVSHHGTSTNSSSSLSYLQNISPEYAVISGTATSPKSTTLSNLVSAGVNTIYYADNYSLDVPEVYRANGNIVITTDGSTYSFSGGNPSFSHGPFQVDEVTGPTPTPTPPAAPTQTPTTAPTSAPTRTPTSLPTQTPTPIPPAPPTKTPTPIPTQTPKSIPPATATPPPAPTSAPTVAPTSAPTDVVTPAPPPTATPLPDVSPTPAPPAPEPMTPIPGPLPVAIELGQESARAGGTLSVSAVIQPVDQLVDAYLAFRSPDGMFYFCSASGISTEPNAYLGGVRFPQGWSGKVLDMRIPDGVTPGVYACYGALFPAGQPPRLDGGALDGIVPSYCEVTRPSP